jgi:predicted nucleic acid-binding Zn ribbon protein
MADKRKKMPRPLAVANLLDGIFAGHPLEGRLREGRIWQVWDTVVGKGVAAKAQPVGFRDGTLTVVVSSAPWMQQLTFLKKGIIDKLNEKLGDDLVHDLYLKAGKPHPPSRTPSSSKKPERPLTEEESLRIAEQTASVSDPELREALAGILSRSLKTQ